ncbi:uncharacterized protein LOC129722042 [Wyeomyia smithii]|uniref:uncharacterized protein LOC129722042 n=1 Tax=Wyeomyia smithii TaxID=174621 RepID=UPI002467B3C2|nr:uncharacterized protein LOC129722042 [Wyeomyia smithii]
MDAERDLSKFLYQLSREIVTSRDYSDCNINKICSKYYEHSNYPDKERLRKLVADLKRKLQIYQQETTSVSPSTSFDHETLSTHQCNCNTRGQQTSFAVHQENESFSVKCVGTQSVPFIPRLMVTDETHYQAKSAHSFPSRNSHNTVASCPSNACELSKHQETPRSSQESETLIEQILLKHSGINDTSSEVLMRMAASDRVLYDNCNKGQCPLHGHDKFASNVAGPSSSCANGGARTQRKTTCNCPLKQCKHFDKRNTACGAGGIGCSACASDAPTLKQEPIERNSSRVGCCGKKRKKKPSCTRNPQCKGKK